ncbi:MAG TPA: non-homologous end-joining DNA ligase, partial [Balneolaceae bacterium]|nr:non-homologous end-joining DNA ligase [Balneolaceae bacterium]
MAGKNQLVEIGKRKLEISNLEKILYPGEQISKAEVIEYYLSIAPTMLYHIKGRPLMRIRFPDGIAGERFFQKNTPDWMPNWIETISLGTEKKKNYMVATQPASLVWLANLAALELHQMHSRKPHYDEPDYMVFDLDPPENADFQKVVETAFALKEHIEQFEYHTFVKTTGGKGVHIVVPIKPQAGMSEVLEAAKKISQPFVQEHNDETTLQIKKNARKGRILIDIYRNRRHQTIVSPYSLRGRAGAPVSMPLSWDELAATESSAKYHLKNAVEKVKTDGDAWEGIGGYATVLHTKRSAKITPKKPDNSPRHKSPEELDEYSKKRNFTKTKEPGSEEITGEGNRFVIQRHHASRLHYDLRLEQDGVLKSWAVPKGLPPRPGVKRLAVQTEDHPLKYLTFEGTIPKGEYGGGDMWIYAQGKYETTQKKKNGLYFRLESEAVSGEYRMHKMKGEEWLLEKVEQPQVDWLNDQIEPMQAVSVDEPPKGDYVYEVKWDGIRALIALEDGQIRIRTRNQNDITKQFPELQDAGALRATCGLFDGEIVCLDEQGKPSFQKVIHRMKRSDKSAIERLSKTQPAYCYVFDCLYLDGRPITKEPLLWRYEWLNDSIKTGTNYRMSEMIEDGEALFKAAKEHGLEGIMAKKKDSQYLPGKRSDFWQKIKVRHTVDCVVIGYSKGKGDRSKYFGALYMAERKDDELVYRGKVGTGFNEQSIREVYEELEKIDRVKKPSDPMVPDEKKAVWVEPKVVIEITYARMSSNEIFKESVFV